MRHEALAASTSAHLVVLDDGDEVMASLGSWAAEVKCGFASFHGLGAVSAATVAFYERATKSYDELQLDEQLEVLSIIGNVSHFDGAHRVHAHVVLSRPDGSTVGGHLVRATVWPTLEVSIAASSQQVRRTMRDEVGLPLLDLDRR